MREGFFGSEMCGRASTFTEEFCGGDSGEFESAVSTFFRHSCEEVERGIDVAKRDGVDVVGADVSSSGCNPYGDADSPFLLERLFKGLENGGRVRGRIAAETDGVFFIGFPIDAGGKRKKSVDLS